MNFHTRFHLLGLAMIAPLLVAGLTQARPLPGRGRDLGRRDHRNVCRHDYA